MARGACGVGERYVGWAERDRRKKTDRVGMLRGEFTLQLYRRLCERGFAVGRSGGDAAAHFGEGIFGMLRSARTGPGAARFLRRRAVGKTLSLPPASNHKKLRDMPKYTRAVYE